MSNDRQDVSYSVLSETGAQSEHTRQSVNHLATSTDGIGEVLDVKVDSGCAPSAPRVQE